jgi:hypothetical protein
MLEQEMYENADRAYVGFGLLAKLAVPCTIPFLAERWSLARDFASTPMGDGKPIFRIGLVWAETCVWRSGPACLVSRRGIPISPRPYLRGTASPRKLTSHQPGLQWFMCVQLVTIDLPEYPHLVRQVNFKEKYREGIQTQSRELEILVLVGRPESLATFRSRARCWILPTGG